MAVAHDKLGAQEHLRSIPLAHMVDAAWMTQVLQQAGINANVAQVDAEQVGTGQLGSTLRFRLRYEGSGRGPETLIGKFAATDENSRAIAKQWSLYEREIRFYNELAVRARINVPVSYMARLEDDGSFILLLEDLAPARPGDQIMGVTPVVALRAVREAARLHAAFWNHGDDPDLTWLETGQLAQPFYSPDVFRSVWPVFRDRYAGLLEPEHLQTGDAFAERYEGFSRPLDRPRCVTHNDFRPDNMLFVPDGGDDRLTVVDWQSAALGHNAVDVAYFIAGGFATDDRRGSEAMLLSAYLRELRAQGVEDYSADALREDYRHFSFAGINVAVGAAMLVKRTERGDRMFLTMLDRHVRHVLDTNALAILMERC